MKILVPAAIAAMVLVTGCSKQLEENAPVPTLKAGSVSAAAVPTVNFSSYTWYIKSGTALGPGPNNWNANNVTSDVNGLHLKITPTANSSGSWDCAEVSTTVNLGFGTYEWVVEGNLDFAPEVVLGLFNYLYVKSPNRSSEVDIEVSHWGDKNYANILNYSVWYPKPVGGASHYNTDFPLPDPTTATTVTRHLFTWKSNSVSFRSYYGTDSAALPFASRDFTPASPTKYIPQSAMPVHINLWVFRGTAVYPGTQELAAITIKSFAFKKL